MRETMFKVLAVVAAIALVLGAYKMFTHEEQAYVTIDSVESHAESYWVGHYSETTLEFDADMDPYLYTDYWTETISDEFYRVTVNGDETGGRYYRSAGRYDIEAPPEPTGHPTSNLDRISLTHNLRFKLLYRIGSDTKSKSISQSQHEKILNKGKLGLTKEMTVDFFGRFDTEALIE